VCTIPPESKEREKKKKARDHFGCREKTKMGGKGREKKTGKTLGEKGENLETSLFLGSRTRFTTLLRKKFTAGQGEQTGLSETPERL